MSFTYFGITKSLFQQLTKKIEINFIHSYDVLFNLQPTTVNAFSNLIQFQSNFNSILEPSCQNKLWWDPFQIKKRKTKFKILKLIIWFQMKKWILKNIFHFSNLVIELKDEKRKKNFFLNLFWFKTDFKKQKWKLSN